MEEPQDTLYSELSTPQFSIHSSRNMPFKFSLGKQQHNDRYASYIQDRYSQILQADPHPEGFPSHGTRTREEIEQLRNETEFKLEQLRRDYLDNEKELLNQLEDDEERRVLVATRPDMLESGSKLPRSPIMPFQPGEFEDKFLSPLASGEFGTGDQIESLKAELEQLRRNNGSLEVSPQNFKLSLTSTLSHEMTNQQKVEEYAMAVQAAYEEALAEREAEIRRQYEEDFEEEKMGLVAKYEKEMKQVMQETQANLDKFWRKKFLEAQNQSGSAYSDRKRRLQYDEAINKERERIYREVEGRLQKELTEKLKDAEESMKQSAQDTHIDMPSKEDLDQYKEQQEMELELRVASEKESWKRDLTPQIIEELRQQVKEETQQTIQRKQEELKDQADEEVNEIIQKIRAENEQALSIQLKKIESEMKLEISHSEDKIREDCIRELQNDPDFLIQEGLVQSIKTEVEDQLRQELRPSIELEIRNTLEPELREEISQQFQQDLANKRTRLEQETRARIRELEEDFELRHNDDTMNSINQKLSKAERDIKIQYMRQLDNQKAKILQEVKKQTADMIQREKQMMGQLKAEVARLKAVLNVEISKMKQDKQKEISFIRENEDALERKMRSNESMRRAQESYHMTKDSILVETSLPSQILDNKPSIIISKVNNLSPSKTSVLSHLNNDYQFDSIEGYPSQYETGEAIMSTSEVKRKLLEHYDSKRVVSELINKNLEEARKQAYKLLEETETPPQATFINYYHRTPQETTQISSAPEDQSTTIKLPLYYRSKERSATPKKSTPNRKTTKYEALLKQKHNVIEPRLKQLTQQ